MPSAPARDVLSGEIFDEPPPRNWTPPEAGFSSGGGKVGNLPGCRLEHISLIALDKA